MILLMALANATLFGVGATLMLSRDLVRITAGTILMSNAVIFFIVLSGLHPPLVTLQPLQGVDLEADPLAQVLALTAIVITFGVTAFLLGLTRSVYRTYGEVDIEEIARAEEREESEIEREPEEV